MFLTLRDIKVRPAYMKIPICFYCFCIMHVKFTTLESSYKFESHIMTYNKNSQNEMDISCNFKLVFSSSSIHNFIIPFIIKLKITMKMHLQAILVLELDFTHQKLIGVYKVFLYDSQLE